jgi:DNA-binding response OmpR family regulator
MRAVLIVSRHPETGRIAQAFERAGFTATASQPDRLTEQPGPRVDAVVLDLQDLPASTFHALHDTYHDQDVVIVLLVPAEQLDRVAVDLDIDDFALLPATAQEVIRRVERALWRKHGVDTESFVHCGALTLDLANYKVSVDGEPLVLTFKEYELLRFLAMNSGRVFTREQLLNRVWGYDYFGGARTVDVHIRRIRSKIEIHGHQFIETVRNVGYRLVADARATQE